MRECGLSEVKHSVGAHIKHEGKKFQVTIKIYTLNDSFEQVRLFDTLAEAEILAHRYSWAIKAVELVNA